MKKLRIRDVMTNSPLVINPKDTVEEAAMLMRNINCGVLPIGSIHEPTGIITDRDIVVRVVAAGRDPAKTLVQDIMTTGLYSCDEDDSLPDAAEKMRRHSVRRLLVTKGKKLTGIVNFTRLIRNKGDKQAAEEVLYALDKIKPVKKQVVAGMGTAGAGSESYNDQFDDVL